MPFYTNPSISGDQLSSGGLLRYPTLLSNSRWRGPICSGLSQCLVPKFWWSFRQRDYLKPQRRSHRSQGLAEPGLSPRTLVHLYGGGRGDPPTQLRHPAVGAPSLFRPEFRRHPSFRFCIHERMLLVGVHFPFLNFLGNCFAVFG
jgi:hypothetical protein